MRVALEPHGVSNRKLCFVAALLHCGVILPCSASDWTQYRGPNHDGISPDRITRNWSGSVTNPVWRVLVTNGLSSFAISGGKAFTQIRRTINDVDKEVCVALSTTNGAELWASTVDDALYDGGVGYDDGPRSTPTVDNGSVYILSSYLNLFRLDAANGSVIWQQDLRAIYGGDVIPWQNAASPLLENGLIYLNANCGSSTLMALRASDGTQVWSSQDEEMTHSTPILATIHGARQVIFAAQSGLVSLNPQTGDLLWKHPYSFFYNTSLGASPVVWDDIVFVTGAHAYGMGSMAVRANLTSNAWTTTRLWSTNNPASHWMTPVAYNGFLFGQFGIQFFDATPATQLQCIDMRTGAVKWTTANFGHGGTLLVDDNLVVLTEMGDLVLAKPDTNAYVELGRFQAIAAYNQDFNKCWNSFAVADGRIYVRSTSYGACFNLSIPNLKLDPPRPVASGKLQLTIRAADGSAIDSNRMAAIEVRGTTNVALALDAWPKLTNSILLNNGSVLVTNIDSAVFPRRFFLVTEPK
jgi:outer membrane protein assembly factor BamB